MKSYRSLALIRIVALSIILFYSCTKTYREAVSLFWGTIITPKNVAAGQPIISKVQIQYSTTSFQVNFRGFQVKQKSNQHFTISASALITSHGESTANTAAWSKDTTCILPTGLAGRYILDYIYTDSVVHSDTVMVR